MIEYSSYSIVLTTYKPSNTFYELIESLYDIGDLKIYIVDSSPELDWLIIKNQIDLIISKNDCIIDLKYFHTENKGVPHSINYGITKCIENGIELFTIMDDDTSVIPQNFKTKEIVNFFNKFLNPEKDLLILADGKSRKKIDAWVDTGLTFTKSLFNKTRFREEFVMDQTDIEFCKVVLRNNGKIVMYPEKVLFNKPVGSESMNEVNILPAWRIYTLTRSVLIMWIEGNIGLYNILYNTLLFFKGLMFGRKKLSYLMAFLYGAIDGLNHDLGVTANLNKLSNNRFKL